MKRATVVIAMTALTATVAAPALGRPVDCRRSGQTVASDETVRVFRVGPRSDDHVLYACWVHTRRVRYLGERATYTAEPSNTKLRALTNRWVVVEHTSVSRDGRAEHSMELIDMSRRRWSRSLALAADQVSAVALTARGSAAWTERAGVKVRVVALTRSGPLVLDDLPGVEFGSVAMSEQHAFWMRDGQPRSARLP